MSRRQVRADEGAGPGDGRRINGAVPGLRLAGAAGLALAAAMAGCESDSWMDPSLTGRWEFTPAEVPILRRIASIEGPEDRFVEVAEVTAQDLIPQVEAYRLGPGDELSVTMWDVPIQDQANEFPRTVDTRGMVDLPQVGQVYVAGKSVEGAQEAIAAALREKDLDQDPLVTVVVRTARQQTFTVLGAVREPGPYFVPAADYKLLDALAVAGGFPESTKEIFVIRQIPLSEEVAGTPGQPHAPDAEPAPTPEPDAEKLIDIIDEITDKPPQGGSPGLLGGGHAWSQPQTPPAEPAQPPAEPAIELIPSTPQAQPPAEPQPTAEETTWVFLNGRWVPVKRAAGPEEGGPGTIGAGELVTQRVLRIPVKPLLAGDARYNVVIRPGDVVRVPSPPDGLVYVGGTVQRPGVFDLAEDLTFTRLLDSAGGLNQLGIPERIDLIRMVGDDRQAMIRLNARAIAEGTQPDFFLKANDRINVGSSFWAYPLSVIRNGFRTSYGYGFVMDRNFGNDVFGAPPSNRFDE